MKETAHVIQVRTPLVGIVAHPDSISAFDLGLLLLNAGVVHHVGPNRLYVTLARRYAELGIPSIRFDFSGIGDSPPREDRLPLQESCVAETIDGMDHLQRTCGCRRFLLLGLCSGAEAALLTAAADPRVAGAILINPRRFGLEGSAYEQLRELALRRHYRRMAFHSSFSAQVRKRLLRGALGWSNIQRAIRSMWMRQRSAFVGASGLNLMSALVQRGTQVYCLHSEADEGLDHLNVLLEQARHLPELQSGLTMEVIPRADHTFTLGWSQDELIRRLIAWTQRQFPIASLQSRQR